MNDALVLVSLRSGGAALVASAIAAPIIYKLLIRMGSRQTVSEFVPEHGAKQGTPTMGGLIMVVGVLAALIASGERTNFFTGFLFVWFAFIGFLDDFLVPRLMPGKRGLGWMPKLVLQFVPFLVMWLLEPAAPMWLIGVTAFTVLFFANAYNFADGMDGLAGGIGMSLAVGTVLIALLLGHPGAVHTQIPLLVGLLVSFVPFLYLNAPPARVFMGDVGSLPIGALLGMGFLQSTLFVDPAVTNWNNLLYASPLLIVLIIELVPGPLQIASAKLRKGKRLFPFSTPVHHGFQAAGWPETRVVATFVLTQFLAMIAAVALCAYIVVGAKP